MGGICKHSYGFSHLTVYYEENLFYFRCNLQLFNSAIIVTDMHFLLSVNAIILVSFQFPTSS